MVKIYQKGILPLSADPITYGHIDLIRRALAECHQLLVAVTDNPAKNPIFDSGSRIKQVERALKERALDADNLQVIMTSELLTDIVMREEVDVIYRGIRDDDDLEYEKTQALYHQMAYPPMTSKLFINLPATPHLAHINSSVVREFARRHVDVTSMTPMFVQARLWRVLHNQKVVGVRCASDALMVGFNLMVMQAFQASSPGIPIPVHFVDMRKCDEDLDKEGTAGWKAHKGSDLAYYHQDRWLRGQLQGKTGVVFVYLHDPLFIPRVNCNVLVFDDDVFLQHALDAQTRFSYGSVIQCDGSVLKFLAEDLLAKVRSSVI